MKRYFVLSLLLATLIIPAAIAEEPDGFQVQYQQVLDGWINAELKAESIHGDINRLERRLDGHPQDGNRLYWESRIALFRGQIFYELNDKRASLQELEHCIELTKESNSVKETSENWRIMSEAGSLYMMQKGMIYIMNHSSEALDQAKRALELDPRNARGSLIVAQYFCNAPPIAGGDLEEGLSSLEELQRRTNLSIEDQFYIHLTLSEVYLDEKQKDRALDSCRKALELYPGNLAAIELMTSISSRI
jgi:tetratricopeptide (TPR) repeat protein